MGKNGLYKDRSLSRYNKTNVENTHNAPLSLDERAALFMNQRERYLATFRYLVANLANPEAAPSPWTA